MLFVLPFLIMPKIKYLFNNGKLAVFLTFPYLSLQEEAETKDVAGDDDEFSDSELSDSELIKKLKARYKELKVNLPTEQLCAKCS